jgi:hypothetical protein
MSQKTQANTKLKIKNQHFDSHDHILNGITNASQARVKKALRDLAREEPRIVEVPNDASPIFKILTERLDENISAINVSLYEIGHKLAQLSTPDTLLLEDETEVQREESVVGVITDNMERLERVKRTLERFKNHLDTVL